MKFEIISKALYGPKWRDQISLFRYYRTVLRFDSEFNAKKAITHAPN